MSIFKDKTLVLNSNYKGLGNFVLSMPKLFANNEGVVIKKGRNEIRILVHDGVEYVVKAFHRPNIINSLVYGRLRSSKAQRSYEYAEMLMKDGIGTPAPVAYYTERKGLFFTNSYYVSLKSECSYTYADLLKGGFPDMEEILRAIARTTAAIHNHGYIHKDYSRGNILFGRTDKGIKVEIIDLNRIRFHKIKIEEGCKNFERLPGTKEMLSIMADEYAKARHFSPEECLGYIINCEHEV